jgi:hypothetical protein
MLDPLRTVLGGLAARLRFWTRPIRGALFYLSVVPFVASAQRELPATVRGHSLAFQRIDGGLRTLATAQMRTGDDSSVTVVSVGRGDISAFELPVDDRSSVSFRQLGETHSYTNWPNSGTALYAGVDAAGGKRRAVLVSTPPQDEITVAAVVVAGQRVQDQSWIEVPAGKPLTSDKVTTTGPATLIAFWWGDAGVAYDKQAVPAGGFRVVDSVLASGALVQCAVAVRHVTEAGTYDVTWRAFPVQGAQLWLVAVE